MQMIEIFEMRTQSEMHGKLLKSQGKSFYCFIPELKLCTECSYHEDKLIWLRALHVWTEHIEC